jgi:hypothetical protein
VAFLLAAFDMPIVSRQVGSVIEHIAPGEVERFPVLVNDDIPEYEILNVLHGENCLDEVRCKHVMRWTAQDHRADFAGKPRMVIGLRIDPVKTGGRHIFRIQDWVVALIVCEEIMRALEPIPDLGIRFDPVT